MTDLTGSWTGTFAEVGGAGRPASVTFTPQGQNFVGQLFVTEPGFGPVLSVLLNVRLVAKEINGTATAGVPLCDATGTLSGSVESGVLHLKIPKLSGATCFYEFEAEAILHR